MRQLLIILLLVFLLSNISAQCNSTQIDINSAPAEELDKIAGIGPSTAQKIIDARPFSSLDDLRKVSGLNGTGKKVEDIKTEGLACVNDDLIKSSETGEENNSTNEEQNSAEEINESDEDLIRDKINNETDIIYENFSQSATAEDMELNPIALNSNSKDIKSEDNKEILKKNLALGGVIAFCVIFGALFLIRKGKYKNEFH